MTTKKLPPKSGCPSCRRAAPPQFDEAAGFIQIAASRLNQVARGDATANDLGRQAQALARARWRCPECGRAHIGGPIGNVWGLTRGPARIQRDRLAALGWVEHRPGTTTSTFIQRADEVTAQIPRALGRDVNLSPLDLAVWAALDLRTGAQRTDTMRTTFATLAELAGQLHQTEGRISKACERLSATGWLIVEPRGHDEPIGFALLNSLEHLDTVDVETIARPKSTARSGRSEQRASGTHESVHESSHLEKTPVQSPCSADRPNRNGRVSEQLKDENDRSWPTLSEAKQIADRHPEILARFTNHLDESAETRSARRSHRGWISAHVGLVIDRLGAEAVTELIDELEDDLTEALRSGNADEIEGATTISPTRITHMAIAKDPAAFGLDEDDHDGRRAAVDEWAGFNRRPRLARPIRPLEVRPSPPMYTPTEHAPPDRSRNLDGVRLARQRLAAIHTAPKVDLTGRSVAAGSVRT